MKNIIYLTVGIAIENNQALHGLVQTAEGADDYHHIAMSMRITFLDVAEHMKNYAIEKPNSQSIDFYIRNAINLKPNILNINDEFDEIPLIKLGKQTIQDHPKLLDALLKALYLDEYAMDIMLTSMNDDHELSDSFLSEASDDWLSDNYESKEIKEHLKSTFFGQEFAIENLLSSIANRSLRNKPSALRQSIFMIGPSGTGKTHLAGLLADYYKTEHKFAALTIDMSSVASDNQQFELIGLTAGYGTAQPGSLTKFISANPDGCVVIFDNLDKANPNCQSVLLEAFDTGYLTDKYQPDSRVKDMPDPLKQNPVDCRNTIFIFTSNVIADFIESPTTYKIISESPKDAKRIVIDKLSKLYKNNNQGTIKTFQADLLSRMSSETVLLFLPLSFSTLMTIAQDIFASYKNKLMEAIGIKISESNLDLCLRAGLYKLGNKLNARLVASDEFIDIYFERVLASIGNYKSINSINLEVSDQFSSQMNVGLDGINDDNVVRELFRKGKYLDFDVRLHQTDKQLSIILENPVWKKAKRSEDLYEDSVLAIEIPNIKFDDIKGHQYAKDKLQEIVKLLKNPSSMKQFSVDPPKGLLLFGEPGTGKTMLAKALANEADLPFLSCTGPDLLNPGQLQSIYKTARHYAPCIVFIDEIDILGDRNKGGYAIAINQLLAEIDGFSGSEERVFTIAATNYPNRLDPAIVRSGRIELAINIPRLDKEARRHFLEKIKKISKGTQLDIEALLDDTAGMTGAEMEQIQRELGMHLIKNGGEEITTALAEDIIAIIRYGEKTGISKDEENRRRTAIHEAGHAIVAMSLKPTRNIERITITSRGNFAGFVKFDEDQRLLKTPEQILNEMAIALGGRCAQMMLDPKSGIDEGAANDLEIVTRYAYLACTTFGFDEKIGWISLPSSHNELAYTGLQAMVNEQVTVWINKARILATEVLEKNKKQHSDLVEMLLKDETLMSNEFEVIRKHVS